MDNLDLRIVGRYRLQLMLGSGGFGAVYEGLDLQTGREVAVKLEQISRSQGLLDIEVSVYEELAGGCGIPQVYFHGVECDYNVMVLELLGPSLHDLFNYCSRQFSLKTVLMLADQLISRFQYIHSRGYVHRDVKPENILMGDGLQGNIVYVVDLGTAAGISRMEARPTGFPFIGTALFASINAHTGSGTFPCDDLESLGYVLIYFIRGCLPWEKPSEHHTKENMKLVQEKKQSTSIQELCTDLPAEFEAYFKHIRSLHFNDKPNYAYLRRLFRNLFRRRGYEYDFIFDWTVLKFLEHLEKEQVAPKAS